jgi:hypothetical protein
MGGLSGAAWLFGILFLLGGLFLVSSLSNSGGNVSAWAMIGILAMLIGALLCYAGSKLKGRNVDTAAARDEPNDDSGGKPRPWWKTDPKYDGALDQQQRRMGLK